MMGSPKAVSPTSSSLRGHRSSSTGDRHSHLSSPQGSRWCIAGMPKPGASTRVGHSPSVADLAPDQLAAVGHLSGPARVIAPAGSGKTRVLTERLRHLVSDCGVHPGTVTALAYNNKAAGELRLRCADIDGAQALNIRTLNSLGLWICNQFGRSGRLRVLEEPGVRDLLQSHIEIRRQANTDTVAPYIEALSAIRLGLTAPAFVEEAMPDAAGIAEDSHRTGPPWPTSARWTSTSRSIGPSRSS